MNKYIFMSIFHEALLSKPNYERYLQDSSSSMRGLSQMGIFFVLAQCPLTFTQQTSGTH